MVIVSTLANLKGNSLSVFFCIYADVASELRFRNVACHRHDLSEGVSHFVKVCGKASPTGMCGDQFVFRKAAFFNTGFSTKVLLPLSQILHPCRVLLDPD